MSDDTKNAGPEDGKRISLTQKHELDYWCSALGVSRKRLREVVKEVGSSAAAVRTYLGQSVPVDAGNDMA